MKSVEQILKDQGYIVTSRGEPGKRIITDIAGNEIRFLSPLDALEYARNNNNEFNSNMMDAYYCVPCGAINVFDCACDKLNQL